MGDEVQPGRLASLKQAIVGDLSALEGQPVEQARYLAEAIETVIGLQSVYADKRRQILIEMRKTSTAAQIAEDMGISRARVYQILRG